VFSDQVHNYDGLDKDYISILCLAEHTDLGLLLVSRQVYHETALLPYKLAAFVFDGKYPLHPMDAQVFLEERSEAQLAVLGRMEVVCCKKRWNGTGADFFSKEIDYILDNGTDHWADV